MHGRGARKGVKLLVFPELTLTGCFCYDLVGHRVLLEGAAAALEKVVKASEGTDMLVLVGLPYAFGSRLLSCAAVIYDGALLALIPRENVAGSRFADYPGEGELVYVGALETELCPGALFAHRSLNGLTVAVELGADVTAADSPRRITPSPGRRSLRRWPPSRRRNVLHGRRAACRAL